MRFIYLVFLIAGTLSASVLSEIPANGTLILVDDIASVQKEDIVSKYGVSWNDYLELKKNREELGLKTYVKTDDEGITISIIGAINRPGNYTLKEGATIEDLIAHARGLGRLSSSKLILRRGDTIYRIYIGRSHSVSPIIKEILPLFLLKEGDIVWISEVTPC